MRGEVEEDDDGNIQPNQIIKRCAPNKTCFTLDPAESAARPSTSTLTCRSQLGPPSSSKRAEGGSRRCCLEEVEKTKRETRVFLPRFRSNRFLEEEESSSISQTFRSFENAKRSSFQMSLGFRPYLVAFCASLAGASVIHAVQAAWWEKEKERRREREREREKEKNELTRRASFSFFPFRFVLLNLDLRPSSSATGHPALASCSCCR